MKKVFHLFSFVVLFIVLCITNVNASECTTKELRELKTLAKKVQIVYEFDEQSNLFDLTAYNLNKKFYLYLSDSSYFQSDKNEFLGSFIPGNKIEATIYAANITNCEDSKLAALKISLPHYNAYSTRKECINNEKKDICKKWSDTSSIDEKRFLELINSYNNSEKSGGFFEKVISFVTQYSVYLIVGLAVVVIIIVLMIFIRKKRKNKLDGIRSLV